MRKLGFDRIPSIWTWVALFVVAQARPVLALDIADVVDQLYAQKSNPAAPSVSKIRMLNFSVESRHTFTPKTEEIQVTFRLDSPPSPSANTVRFVRVVTISKDDILKMKPDGDDCYEIASLLYEFGSPAHGGNVTAVGMGFGLDWLNVSASGAAAGHSYLVSMEEHERIDRRPRTQLLESVRIKREVINNFLQRMRTMEFAVAGGPFGKEKIAAIRAAQGGAAEYLRTRCQGKFSPKDATFYANESEEAVFVASTDCEGAETGS